MTFERRDSPIPVTENVYSWMTSWIRVFDHPWFATTGDGGSFTIEGVPVGTHTLHAWHETFGETTVKVTVTAGATTRVEPTLSAD